MAKQSIEITGLDSLKKGLTALQLEHYPTAVRKALNDVVRIVHRGEQQLASAELNHPTPYTLNAFKVRYASKTKLAARVFFQDPARLHDSQHYLYPNVYGTKRGYKPFEGKLYSMGLLRRGQFVVPGKSVKLDSYGNAPRGLYQEIIAWFQGNKGDSAKKNITAKGMAKKRKGTRSKYGYEWLVVKERKGRLIPGIYKRTFLNFTRTENGKARATSLQLVFLFVTGISTYENRVPFHAEGKKIFNAFYKISFGQEMEKAIRAALK